MVSPNKRIAKNTVFIYIRLFLTMFLGLFTSRIVLQVLGVSDYGLFSVVGGVLAMFTFFSGSLSVATSRFLNTEMGKSDGDVNKSYNINMVLHIGLSIIIFILAETIGLWYIFNKLTVETGKLEDAVFVYQTCILTVCAGIINTPCYSLFFSHEKIQFITLFDIFNTLIRFGCILLLKYYDGDYALRLYSLIMCLTTANQFVVFQFFARRKWWAIVRWRFIKGWNNYKEVLYFSNWNLLGTMALMGRSSGTDLIMNSFFGTVTNGAYAISKTVYACVNEFSANLDGASGPQIVQAFAAGNMERCNYLVNKIGRFCLLLFELIFFPLFIELDYILELWLGVVPEEALVFCQLNLFLCGVGLTGSGLNQIITATGKIKWFKIQYSIILLLCLPIGYYLYSIGFPTYTLLILFILADIVQRTIQLILLKKLIEFDSIQHVKMAYPRPLLIFLLNSIWIVLYNHYFSNNSWICVLSILFTFILIGISVYKLGLTAHERDKLRATIENYLNHK